MAQIENNLVSKLVPAILAIEQYPEPVGFKFLYACTKHKATLVKHAEDFDAVRLKALKEEYSEKDKEGNPVMVPQLVNGVEAINEQTGEVIKGYKIAEDKKDEWKAFYDDIGKQLVDVPDYKVSMEDIKTDLAPGRIPFLTDLLQYIIKD